MCHERARTDGGTDAPTDIDEESEAEAEEEHFKPA
jgi:hypothetical protein